MRIRQTPVTSYLEGDSLRRIHSSIEGLSHASQKLNSSIIPSTLKYATTFETSAKRVKLTSVKSLSLSLSL